MTGEKGGWKFLSSQDIIYQDLGQTCHSFWRPTINKNR